MQELKNTGVVISTLCCYNGLECYVAVISRGMRASPGKEA